MIFKCFICGDVLCTCPEDDDFEESDIETEFMCSDCMWDEGSVFFCDDMFHDLTEFIMFEEIFDMEERCN